MTVSFPEDLNLADYFLFDRLDEDLGDTPALLFGDRAWTYAEVASRAGALARWFVESGSAPDHPLSVRVIPNPASTGVDIAFTLPAAGRARIEVFDLFGRRIARLPDADLGAGSHHVRWTGVTEGGGRPRPALYVVRVSSGANRGHVTLAWR